ncbi:hypothetical protein Tdes44962_MAKER00763 [Teratosphaeria destructans]|uniref:Uncharacterized protein n=1 Tax=Teratosphaeria destructans TaxID=418781 RepID=A0A9W7SLZ1_9PEZI|nr:hypothetical protein Tdes44962_MAKER00763 [Teratosphaeria destructans]
MTVEHEPRKPFEIFEDEPPQAPKRRYIIKQERPVSSSAQAAHHKATAATRQVPRQQGAASGRTQDPVGQILGSTPEVDNQQSTESLTRPMSVMEEYLQAYRDIRPGGAFARPTPSSKFKQQSRKLNILGPHWNL